ncbi:hypothetical protein Tco_0912999 [Tanacetum coccineum]
MRVTGLVAGMMILVRPSVNNTVSGVALAFIPCCNNFKRLSSYYRSRHKQSKMLTSTIKILTFREAISSSMQENRGQKIPESPWGSPIPIGDGDGDVNRFPDGDGDGDGDEAEKRRWGCAAQWKLVVSDDDDELVCFILFVGCNFISSPMIVLFIDKEGDCEGDGVRTVEVTKEMVKA